ncbi:hypothetical protein BRADI_1g52545v3 [Brachypodium distachyon]|uniref:Uncharacterized protein n=1 Tax=Brachypodium distachyon TaxID=15368 RepID=A0A2K2DR39_BRADI|nr:hypothetical protein BRADI_1g52545v3 [Brachypodium distachyon]
MRPPHVSILTISAHVFQEPTTPPAFPVCCRQAATAPTTANPLSTALLCRLTNSTVGHGICWPVVAPAGCRGFDPYTEKPELYQTDPSGTFSAC